MRESKGSCERHARLKELFFRVVELEEEARGPFIDAACGDDVDLRSELESLLKHHRPSDLPRSTRDE
jgi:hypothetical protein